MARSVKFTSAGIPSSYDIAVAGGSLSDAGRWARRILSNGARRVAVVSNRKVFDLYGGAVSGSLEAAGFDVVTILIGDGERFKNLRTFDNVIGSMSEAKLTRSDAVMALGGGVVGDVAGFAASAYLRGVSFLQVPTTLLAMIDSSVGGKTGINLPSGKNLVGAFYQPAGVLIDPTVIRTLDSREVTAGLCEAAKQAALGGRRMLKGLQRFLSRYDAAGFAGHFQDEEFRDGLEAMIAEQIEFKARIVRGDEREATVKSGPRSRKILNFGHTLAHALEAATDFRYFRHGEAVGYGIMYAASLSKKLEFLPQSDIELLNDVVRRAGVLPSLADIDPAKVLDLFRNDKKVVNDSLQWILLSGIGKPVIVPQSRIPHSMMLSTLDELIGR